MGVEINRQTRHLRVVVEEETPVAWVVVVVAVAVVVWRR
jgi:hypothetical protein